MLLVKKYPPICKKYDISLSVSFGAEISESVQLLWRTVTLIKKGLFPKVLKSFSSFPCLPSEFGALLMMS